MAWQPFLYVINGSLSVDLSAARPEENVPEDVPGDKPLSGAQASQSNTPAGSPADINPAGSRATSRRWPE
jgi:hypothetical protein